MITADRQRRILDALVHARMLLHLRDGPGNPHHDSEGKFTGAGGEGHAQPHGKHHARRQRRKARRKKRAQDVHQQYKAEASDLKARHRKERVEHVKGERKDRAEKRRDQAKERRTTAREHARERVSQAKGHEKERAKWDKKFAKKKAKVTKEHEAKSAKLDKAEKQAKNLPKRHKRESAKLEQHIASGQHAKDVQKITADQVAKAKAAGKPVEDVAAIEARGREISEKGAIKARESLAKQHEAERAKAESLPKLRERLTKQTEARLARAEQGPQRLAAYQAKQVKGLAHRQKREVKEQKVEHADEMKSIKEDQAGDRVSLKATHKEERQELVERYESDLAEVGFRRKRKRVTNESAGRNLEAEGTSRTGPDAGPGRTEVVSRGERSRTSDTARTQPAVVEGSIGEGTAYRNASSNAPTRTHKASSAESILRYCLRQRGWTAAFRRGELTDRQHRMLLEDVRQYSREWMRHEAEVLFASYGRETDAPDGRLQFLESGGGTLSRRDVADSAGLVPTSGSEIRALSDTIAHHVGRWFGRARQFVREAILAGIMGLFGSEPLTAGELEDMDEEARRQDAYLDRFLLDAHYRTPAEIGEGEPALKPMTAPQFIARAQQYGDAPWGAAQAVARKAVAKMPQGAANQERRVHVGRDAPCPVCVAEQAKGWVPLGTLRAIGDSDCKCSCHCHFEYRNADGEKFITPGIPRRRRKQATAQPSPRPIPIQPASEEPEISFDVNVIIGKGP